MDSLSSEEHHQQPVIASNEFIHMPAPTIPERTSSQPVVPEVVRPPVSVEEICRKALASIDSTNALKNQASRASLLPNHPMPALGGFYPSREILLAQKTPRNNTSNGHGIISRLKSGINSHLGNTGLNTRVKTRIASWRLNRKRSKTNTNTQRIPRPTSLAAQDLNSGDPFQEFNVFNSSNPFLDLAPGASSTPRRHTLAIRHSAIPRALEIVKSNESATARDLEINGDNEPRFSQTSYDISSMGDIRDFYAQLQSPPEPRRDQDMPATPPQTSSVYSDDQRQSDDGPVAENYHLHGGHSSQRTGGDGGDQDLFAAHHPSTHLRGQRARLVYITRPRTSSSGGRSSGDQPAQVPSPARGESVPKPVDGAIPRRPMTDWFGREELLGRQPAARKKHPSPTKAEWIVLESQWQRKIEDLGM